MVELAPTDERAILDYLRAALSADARSAARADRRRAASGFVPRLAGAAVGTTSARSGRSAGRMIWWVGQQGNTIGRINPRTDEVREWPLPAGALPHSVNVDAQGGVWYMGNGNGTIGKFDPATGQAREYRMPDPNARDPHTAEFDRNGIMWFTLQQSNMIGRFDPRSGDIRLVTVQARACAAVRHQGRQPMGRCGSRATAAIASSESIPQTMALTEIDLPGEDTTVRRLDIAERRHDLVRELRPRQLGALRSADRAKSANGDRRAGRTRIPTPSP